MKVEMYLFFVDNIYRYTLAGTEVSALLGRMPSAVGYQPTLADRDGAIARTYYFNKNMVLLLQFKPCMYLRMTYTDPAPATTFTHLDATT
ncbi:MAG: hypothetical protein V9E89_15120 [Ilumatobacteraceae bacterium]